MGDKTTYFDQPTVPQNTIMKKTRWIEADLEPWQNPRQGKPIAVDLSTGTGED